MSLARSKVYIAMVSIAAATTGGGSIGYADVAVAEASSGRAEMDRPAAGFMVAELMGLPVAPPATKPSTGQARADVNEVMEFLSRKEFDKALARTAEMIRANPNDADAYHLQGGAYIGKQELANARKSFEKALSLQPGNVPVLLNLAGLDEQRKDDASARKRYQTILDKDSSSVPAMLGMAQLEARSGNDGQSLAWLEKAKYASRDNLAIRMRIGATYLRMGSYAKALTELTDAQRHNPDDPELLDLVGQAQLANGQNSQAVLTYRKLASVSPKSPAAFYRLALAQANDGDNSEATESLKKALQLKPDFEEAIVALAGLEVRAGRAQAALKLAADLHKLAPKSPAGRIIEGDVYAAQAKYVDAAVAYEKAFAIRSSSLLTVKLHATYAKAGNAKAADAKVQQWLKDHPDDIAVRQYLAVEYLKSGKIKPAIEQYELVLKKDAKNASALNNLANLYYREKDPRALATAEQAYKLAPDSPAAADTLGWILVEQGTTGRGLELLLAAAAKDPNNTEVQYHLAVALTKSGDKKQARKVVESLLAGGQKFPERDAAEVLLKQL